MPAEHHAIGALLKSAKEGDVAAALVGTNEHGSALNGTEPSQKRVMGLEPIKTPQLFGQNRRILEGAGSAAGSAQREIGVSDPDLRAIMEAWAALPADLRKMILGVVKLTANNRTGKPGEAE